MKLWVYDDIHNWGYQLQRAAERRGWDVSRFDNVHDVQNSSGFLFLRMHFHPAVRDVFKRMMAHFATLSEVTIVPSYRATVLYDDRIEQIRQFSQWMPPSLVFLSPSRARQHLDGLPRFPFVSKSSCGQTPANIRTLYEQEDARKEIRMTFSDLGIKCALEQRQRGYLVWQKFIQNRSRWFRVIRVGNEYLVARVHHSGDTLTFSDTAGDDAAGGVALALDFFQQENICYGAVDVMYDEELEQWFVIEFTASWSWAPLTGFKFQPSGRVVSEFWDLLLDEMESGRLD